MPIKKSKALAEKLPKKHKNKPLKHKFEDDNDSDEDMSREEVESAEKLPKKQKNKPLKRKFEDDNDSDEDMSNEEVESADDSASDDGNMSLDEEGITFSGSDDEMEAEASKLAAVGDDSDSEENLSKLPGEVVTKSMVDNWVKLLQKDSLDGLVELVEGFKAALIHSGNAQNIESKYVVKGNVVFNAIISACMVELVPMLQRILHMKETALPSAKNKAWKKVKIVVQSYLIAVIQFLSSVASADLKESIMKHFQQIIVYCVHFPKLLKLAMKKMISMWSKEDHVIRVIATTCILRLVLHLSSEHLGKSFSQMYAAYVSNCKFTTVLSLPSINYMRNSLVQVMAVKPAQAYQCACVAIQGLAKQQRDLFFGQSKSKGKAKEVKKVGKKGKSEKQENIPAVYNWQYIHSLSLWTTLLCELKSNPKLQTISNSNKNVDLDKMSQALVELTLGTIRVNPSSQYYPLRFFCLRLLIQLTEASNGMTFVEVLPYLTKILDDSSLQKNAKTSSSKKSCNFDCTLRMPKTELGEKFFIDGVVEEVFGLILHYCASCSHTIAFPELILPTTQHLRKFMKSCRVPAYTAKMKNLLQKLEEHAEQMKKKRDSCCLNIRDTSSVDSWEMKIKEENWPLVNFFKTWKKKQLEKKEMLLADKETIEAKVEPRLLKERPPKTATEEERSKNPDLFKSYDSDEEDMFYNKDGEDDDDDSDDDDGADEDISVDEDDSDDESSDDEDS